ncbi:hypothetical protein RB213_009895 [Colletotrichum asianum]
MKVTAILMLTAASAVLAAPAPAPADPTPVPAAVDAYADYGKYTYEKYASYGDYGNAPPPPPQPTNYGSYAGYGTYKRALDWIKSNLSKKLNCDGIFTLTTILNIPQPYRWSYQDLGFGSR